VAVFLARAQAALPPWLAGPSALGNPLPWTAPAALTILFGATGGVRIFAMMVAFLALRRLFRAGVGGFTRVTAMWVVGLLLLWTLVTGVLGGPSAADDLISASDLIGPGDGYSPRVEYTVDPARRDAYDMADVDRAPYLVNQDALDAALDKASSRVVGGAILHFVVNADGTVDPATVTVTSAGNPEVAGTVTDVVKLLRFVPALKDGRPVAMWTDFSVSVPRR
jgi:hypothetical protein